MKKILLILTTLVVFSSLVYATECTQPGYDYCWENTHVYGDAEAYAKVYFSLVDEQGRHWGLGQMPGGVFAVGRFFADVGLVGDSLYFYENLGDWDNLNCDADGCFPAGDFFDEIAPGEYDLASLGDLYTDCPVFVAYDFDRAPGGDWAWTTAGHGWAEEGNCFGSGIRIVDCYYDEDCPDGYYCDKSAGGDNWRDWECEFGEPPVCEEGDEMCDGTDYISCEDGQWFNNGPTVGKCGVECLIAQDCPEGHQCVDYECVEEEPECESDEDCPDGFECINEECVEESSSNIYLALVGIVVGIIILVMTARQISKKRRRR